MSTLLSYETLKNIRDLGGERTADGRELLPGRLIRCGHLAEVTEDERARLAALADTVIDFRTDWEREGQPDREIPGARTLHIPILDTLTSGITREEEADANAIVTHLYEPEKGKAYMSEMYRAFALSDYSAGKYREFIAVLLEEHDRAVLWHCTAGKDRAGVGAAIVEALLGVPREDIVADYLMTNVYLAEDIRRLTAFVKKQEGTDSPLADESLRYLFGAERDYITSFFDAAEERCGSFEGFAEQVLGLTAADIAHLRKTYTK